MITAIADTSFVLATQNKRDRFHALCRQVYSRQDEIVLPQSTLNEIIYLNTKYRGAFSTIQFLQRLPSLKFKLTALTYDDLARTTALLQRYIDSRLDFVDASIVAVAGRLGVHQILTLDQRDFILARAETTPPLELLP